ncbi:MAG: prolipoprotein diacylglyceryl transferase [Actinomycetaceae bacterium]|nr:prolipoprotein diacylglyceryl transferase [Actinomycetaceae bacterium]
MIDLAIPSPSQGIWYLGPIPIRAYALCILTGIVLTIVLGNKRYRDRGGHGEVMYDIALWAVPLGIIGGRLYHVAITAGPQYFGSGADPWEIFRIWNGGLGIWGGITVGIIGVWIGAHQARIRLAPFLDSLAPMVLYAQAIGRLGNWFNQELFGKPTTVPWGLRIDDAHLPYGYESGTLFHPTFLYEMVWNLLMATVIVLLDKRIRFHAGQISALYLIVYSTGRLITEQFRIDPSEYVLGLRIHVWVSLFGLCAGIIIFYICARMKWPRDVSAQELAATRVSTEADKKKKEAKAAANKHSDIPQECSEADVPQSCVGADDDAKDTVDASTTGQTEPDRAG